MGAAGFDPARHPRGLFGIGLLRHRAADWRLVRMIGLSWVVTLPAGALLASVAYVLWTR
ncbi:MAG: inorganic phosphate transporter [Firmicutes bacterium]|nr:inorganic phosphate transporter [Bacillota bacterium]